MNQSTSAEHQRQVISHYLLKHECEWEDFNKAIQEVPIASLAPGPIVRSDAEGLRERLVRSSSEAKFAHLRAQDR